MYESLFVCAVFMQGISCVRMERILELCVYAGNLMRENGENIGTALALA